MGLELEFRGGRVHLVGGLEDRESWRPSRVVDDVLGLLRESEDLESYRTAYLLVRYGLLYQTASPEQWNELAEKVSKAVELAANGQTLVAAYALGSYFSGARFKSARVVEVDNFPAFVAVCLAEVTRRGPITVAACENCGLPWIVERGASYCERPALNQHASCRTLGAVRRYVDKHGDFHRQRRRLYDRMKRGTLDERVYREWLEANRPGELSKTWVRFEDWQKGKRPKGADDG